MQKQLTNNSLLNGKGQAVAAAVAATTKLANVVGLKGTANSNGSAAPADIGVTAPRAVSIAPLASDDEANDDSSLSAVTIRCQDPSRFRQK